MKQSYFFSFLILNLLLNILPINAQDLNCIPDIKCYTDWAVEANATVRIVVATLDGQGKRGTGILLNNESRNGRAFLLTAFHVIDLDDDGIISQAERNSILNGNNSFTFKYQTTSCNGNALDLAQYAFVNGAIVRAAYKPTDMALLELVGTIPVDVNYAGWNRAAGTPSSGVIIHHPSGSHARIATSSNITLDSDNQLRARYGTGTIARGSSGAGFFNQNHQVIGQLLGSSKDPFSLWRDDCVGCPASWSCPFYINRLSDSWLGGGTPDTQLKAWLSPNQNLSSISHLIPSRINGAEQVCANNSTTYSLELPATMNAT